MKVAWHRKLPWRMVVSFATFALTILVFGGLVHRQAERWSETVGTEALRTTVRLAAHGMHLWLAERFADADVFVGNATFRQSLLRATERPARAPSDAADILESLDAIQRRYNYRSVALIDTAHRSVAFASGQPPTPHDIDVVSSVTAQRVQWIDLTPRSSLKEYRAAVVRRMAEEGPLASYLLFLEVEPLQLVQTTLESRGPDLRGESILMRRQGSELLRFAPERDPGGTVLVFLSDVRPGSLEHRLLTEPQTMAKGTSLAGRPVIAMREALSLPGWYLVSMLDESVFLAGLRHQTRVAVLVYGLLLAGVAAGLAHWVRSERSKQTEREAQRRRVLRPDPAARRCAVHPHRLARHDRRCKLFGSGGVWIHRTRDARSRRDGSRSLARSRRSPRHGPRYGSR